MDARECRWPWLRPGEYDFRTDGPPPWVCDLCGADYKPWEVKREDWELLPERYRPMFLCLEDYRRLVAEAGHDPDAIPVTHRTWESVLDEWRQSKDLPVTAVHVRFDADDGGPAECMWADAVGVRRRDIVVRVRGHGFLFDVAHGDEFLARWQGAVQRGTGRPILVPVERLSRGGARSPARKGRRTKRGGRGKRKR